MGMSARLVKAFPLFQKEINMASNDNDRAEEHFYGGIERFEDNDYDGAIAEFNKSLHFALNHFIALNTRGMCWTMKDEHDKAIRDFSEAIRLEPDDPRIRINRGNSRALKGEYEKANHDFDKAIQLEPNIAVFFGRTEATPERTSAIIEGAISDFDRRFSSNRKLKIPWTIGMMPCR